MSYIKTLLPQSEYDWQELERNKMLEMEDEWETYQKETAEAQLKDQENDTLFVLSDGEIIENNHANIY